MAALTGLERCLALLKRGLSGPRLAAQPRSASVSALSGPIERTGYLRYADANHIVLLFPQTNANTAPNACWDWWGYASSDHLSKTAPQLAAVRAMLDRLAEPREGSPVL